MTLLDSHTHYQIRLVKRFDGAKIVTYAPMAQPKTLKDRDKTLDVTTAGGEKGALQKARNYCRRGATRKGDLAGRFLGVVLVKHVSPVHRSITVSNSWQVTKRPRRVVGTTEWLYFVDPDARAYYVDSSSHIVLERVD